MEKCKFCQAELAEIIPLLLVMSAPADHASVIHGIYESEIFGVAECEIIYSVNCEI